VRLSGWFVSIPPRFCSGSRERNITYLLVFLSVAGPLVTLQTCHGAATRGEHEGAAVPTNEPDSSEPLNRAAILSSAETRRARMSLQFNKFCLGSQRKQLPPEAGILFALPWIIAAICEAQKWRWSVKFQKMIRVQLMLVGLGAGLLLAKPVYAQQDTDPTLFEATSDASQHNQEGFNAPLAPQTATNLTAEAVAPLTVQEEDASVLTSADVNSILALVLGIGSIVLVGIAQALRGSRRRTWRAAGSSQYPSGATAN
jgi:hypothetical protein